MRAATPLQGPLWQSGVKRKENRLQYPEAKQLWRSVERRSATARFGLNVAQRPPMYSSLEADNAIPYIYCPISSPSDRHYRDTLHTTASSHLIQG